jgi:hypothetical protein
MSGGGEQGKHSYPSALSESREWVAITPDELRPAVEAIRHAFEHQGCWQSAQSTWKLCYAALHPVRPNDTSHSDFANLDPYREFLAALIGPQVQSSLLGANHPAPVIFKSYIDVLETALKIVVRTDFQELFEIARVRADVLNMSPVEWAKRHMQILISEAKPRIRTWIRKVCDQRDLSRVALSQEDMFWGDWRAPRLIHMQPAGSTPYDPATAWTREELARSVELLEKRTERFTDFLGFELDELASAVYVQFAKQDDAILRVVGQNASDRGHSLPEGRKSPTAPAVPVQVVKPPSSNNGVASQATWKDIAILFLSDLRVQIRNGPNSETLNYAEFGFKDGRTGNPNQAWKTLLALAENDGVIKDGSAVGKAWPKVEKRIQEIRKVLRDHFGISADPIEFVSGVGYKVSFRIGCGPSFHT